MEVFNQRLEQEYGAEVIVTVPSVPYKSKTTSRGKLVMLVNHKFLFYHSCHTR